MDVEGKLFVGKSTKPEYLTLKLANRHGLITGATGTVLPVPVALVIRSWRFASCSVRYSVLVLFPTNSLPSTSILQVSALDAGRMIDQPHPHRLSPRHALD